VTCPLHGGFSCAVIAAVYRRHVLPKRLRKKVRWTIWRRDSILRLASTFVGMKPVMDNEDPLATANGIALGVPIALLMWYWLFELLVVNVF
jgi:hypothetical protein